MCLYLSPFKKDCLKVRIREREMETHSEIFFPSLLKMSQWPSWGCPKPEASSVFWVFPMGIRTQVFGPLSSPFQGTLSGSWTGTSWSDAHIGCWHGRQRLNHCAIMSPHPFSLFITYWKFSLEAGLNFDKTFWPDYFAVNAVCFILYASCHLWLHASKFNLVERFV